MKRSPIILAHRYGYATLGGGAFVTLYDTERGIEDEQTVFLQGDDATAFIDELERLEESEHITFVVGLENAVDGLIEVYFEG